MRFVALNNGIMMPIVGLGTWGIDSDNLYSIIKKALDYGYTKFDTAWKYNNEEYLGEIFEELKIPREKIFIETKIHEKQVYFSGRWRIISLKKQSIRRAFELQCKSLKTDYIDMYMIHGPFYNFIEMWEEIEKIYHEGRIRAIGVSGFTKLHLEELKRISDVIPALNQIEISPYNTNTDLATDSKKMGIQVEAYTTFNGKPEASQTLLNDECLVKIAQRHNKSVANIICRWAVQHGYSIVPRTNDFNHLKENIDVFSYTLDENEMNDIDYLNRGISIWGDPRKDLNFKRQRIIK